MLFLRKKGIKNFMTYSKNCIPWNKGKKCPQQGRVRLGENNPFYGRKHTKETRDKISEKGIGRICTKTTRDKLSKALKGKIVSKETREKQSKMRKGKINNWNRGKKLPIQIREKISRSLKKWWSNPDNNKIMKKRRRIRITSYELRMMELIKKYKLPYKYVGDGSVWFGKCNPDFLNVNGEKIVLEVYEEVLHMKNYENIRSKQLLEYGYKTIFISGKELFREDWESYCINKIYKERCFRKLYEL